MFAEGRGGGEIREEDIEGKDPVFHRQITFFLVLFFVFLKGFKVIFKIF